MTRATRSGRCSATPRGLFEKSRVRDRRHLDRPDRQARARSRDRQGQDHDPDPAATSSSTKTRVVAKKSASLLGEYLPGDRSGHAVARWSTARSGRCGSSRTATRSRYVTEPVELGEIMARWGPDLPILRQILEDVHKLTSGPIKRHRQQRQQDDRDELRDARAAAHPRRPHRRQHRRHHDRARPRTSRSRSRTSARSPKSIKSAGRHDARARSRRPATGLRGSIDKLQASDRQPREDDEEHGDGDHPASRRARGPSAACCPTTPSRATSRRSPRTRAASSRASPGCRRSSACAPSTTS